MSSFKLTEKEIEELTAKHRTPFLVASETQIEENYNFLRRHLPRARVYYAIKANPTDAIIRRLSSLGACFDAASAGEMSLLNELGVTGNRVIYANTVKDFRGLEAAARFDVRRFTFDDASEIGKMARYMPGADVLVRIRVDNGSALIDLNSKFGAAQSDAVGLLSAARDAGLNPVGVCFHVGSQSFSAAAYEDALKACREIFDAAKERGMKLTDLDIGGGFPIPSADAAAPDLEGMLAVINERLNSLVPEDETSVCCEPGRFICGTAVNLVTSVIGTKERGGKPWYILDEGIYGAFSGILFDHWSYPMSCFAKGEAVPSTLAGPSCDGIDVLYRDIPLPRLAIGDRLLATDIGAYSTVSATRFNGFPIAPTVVVK